MTQTQETPQAAPAKPPVINGETGKWQFVAQGNTIEELCISTAEALLKANAFMAQKSTAKENPTTYAEFSLGDGPTNFRKNLVLNAAQGRKLAAIHGIPMALSFRVALLDLVPAASAEARRRERVAMTAEREAKKVGSIGTANLLEELNKRRVAEGLEPLKG